MKVTEMKRDHHGRTGIRARGRGAPRDTWIAVSDVGPESMGAFAHFDFKVAQLRRLLGPPRATFDLGGSWTRAACMIARAAAAALRRPLLYVRLAPRTLPLVGLWVLIGAPCVAEINGFFVEDHRFPVTRAPMNWVLRQIGRSRRIVVLGDLGYMGYAREIFGKEVRWTTVPLPARVVPGVGRGDPRRCVRYVGTLSQWQGLESLIASWQLLRPSGWTLEIAGSGPSREALEAVALARDVVVRFLGPVSGDDYWETLQTAGVLVAPYEARRGAGSPISSLKGVDYCLTDRPVVLADRDSLVQELRLGAEDLVFATGTRTAPLCDALEDAIAAAEVGCSAPDRMDRVVRARGIDAVDHALRNALANFATGAAA